MTAQAEQAPLRRRTRDIQDLEMRGVELPRSVVKRHQQRLGQVELHDEVVWGGLWSRRLRFRAQRVETDRLSG